MAFLSTVHISNLTNNISCNDNNSISCIGSKFKNPVSVEHLSSTALDTFPCGNYSPAICDFILNKWIKWLGPLVRHSFSVRTKICSKREDPTCTVKDVFDLMISERRFIAPAYEDRNAAVVDGAKTELYGPNLLYSAAALLSIAGSSAPLIGLHLEGAKFTNPVYTKVFARDKDPNIINYTIFPHIFYPGTIKRTISEIGDDIYVETWGEGDAVLPLLPDLNIIGGEAIFKLIDKDMAKKWKEKFDSKRFKGGGGGDWGGGGATGRW